MPGEFGSVSESLPITSRTSIKADSAQVSRGNRFLTAVTVRSASLYIDIVLLVVLVSAHLCYAWCVHSCTTGV